MWQKFLEVLMSVVAFVSMPFVTPEMSKEVITTIPEVATETPAVEVAPVKVPTTPENQEVNKNSTEKSTPAVDSKTIDPYCAKYVSKYTKSEYKKEKTKPEKVKKDCEDQNTEWQKDAEEKESQCNTGESSCKVSFRKSDCSKVYSDARKTFEDWEEQYDSYHARCS